MQALHQAMPSTAIHAHACVAWLRGELCAIWATAGQQPRCCGYSKPTPCRFGFRDEKRRQVCAHVPPTRLHQGSLQRASCAPTPQHVAIQGSQCRLPAPQHPFSTAVALNTFVMSCDMDRCLRLADMSAEFGLKELAQFARVRSQLQVLLEK